MRLLGVGVANFTGSAQEELFFDADDPTPEVTEQAPRSAPVMRRRHGRQDAWLPGLEVEHAEYGRGWVWGAGHGVVTVRFETRQSGVGPVRSLRADDPALHPAELLPMAWQVPDEVDENELSVDEL